MKRTALIGGTAAALLTFVTVAPLFADTGEEARRLIELMEIGPGMTVADVGAGKGEWAEALAEAVGTGGLVYATEVESDLVDDLGRRMDQKGLDNVMPLLGDQQSSGLPASCCDAILLRMVYHHFEDPVAMRASLRQSLKPGGRLAIVDIDPQTHWRRLEGVPDRGGHGITRDALIEEIAGDGFEALSRHDEWNGESARFCVVFRVADQTTVQ